MTPMASKGRRTLVVGTRASKLALWQTNFVIDRLTQTFSSLECRVQTFKTVGDDIVDRPLPELGGKGVFTARLERALLGSDVDIAVHSLKDLPIENTPGLTIGAIANRADARDVLVARQGVDLQSLPHGSVVGTSSLRRQAQLRRARPDLTTKPIRGNVETRIRKVMSGDFDATVLAAAGVDRLGFGDAVSDRLSFEVMLPAPGQGALAVQCRADDGYSLDLLQAIDDFDDRRTALAERAFLAGLGGGCAAPVGAFAEVQVNGSVTMRGVVASPDGRTVVRVEGSGPDGLTLGADLAAKAIKLGARVILDEARQALAGKLPLTGKRIVVTRAAGQDDDFCDALSGLGATPIRLPVIRIVPTADKRSLERAAGETSPGDWVVFTSVNGVLAVHDMMGEPFLKSVRVAAVGKTTASALEERSVVPEFVPETFTGEAIGEGMPDVAGRGVWLLRAETAGEAVVELLTQRGAVVHDIPVYHTEGEPIDASGLAEIEKGVDVVTFTSGSTARNFKTGCEEAGVNTAFLENTAIACIGPVTAEVARELGFDVRVVAEEHTTSGLVDALATYFQ
jgi:hydroxymethylbilane synthase